MISETDKHRASTIQIIGFSLTVPLGNFIVNLLNYELSTLGTKGLFFFVFSLFLAYIGIICLVRSFEIIEEGENK